MTKSFRNHLQIASSRGERGAFRINLIGSVLHALPNVSRKGAASARLWSPESCMDDITCDLPLGSLHWLPLLRIRNRPGVFPPNRCKSGNHY